MEDHAIMLSVAEASERENADVAEAVLRSKSDVLPCSLEGAVILRLTRCSVEIMNLLLSCPELAACRQRVEDAGCDTRPHWANGALLLLPLTVEQVHEANFKLRAHN